MKHTEIYLKHFGYDKGDTFIPCEVCGAAATDTTHIHRRGAGGSKQMDRIENLQALCRNCHVAYGDKKAYKAFLYTKHAEFLFENYIRIDNGSEIANPLNYDTDWIGAQIYKYEFTCPVCKGMNCLNLEHLATYSRLLTSNIK